MKHLHSMSSWLSLIPRLASCLQLPSNASLRSSDNGSSNWVPTTYVENLLVIFLVYSLAHSSYTCPDPALALLALLGSGPANVIAVSVPQNNKVLWADVFGQMSLCTYIIMCQGRFLEIKSKSSVSCSPVSTLSASCQTGLHLLLFISLTCQVQTTVKSHLNISVPH